MFKLNNQLYKIIKRIQNNENNKLKTIQLYNGSSKIINLLHNNTILLYNGKTMVPINITTNKLNVTMGQFVYKRISHNYKEKHSKKKK